MGGSGSGRRWHWSANSTVDDYRSIDVRRWKRDGFLEPWNAFRWQWSIDGEVTGTIDVRTEPGRVFLNYRSRTGGEWESHSYPVHLEWTPCHLGGERPWFLCPARGCGKRVAILYGGAIFACRSCYQLAYPSQREDQAGRALRRVRQIEGRFGWRDGPRQKPKGMHWQTYDRLCAERDRLDTLALASLLGRFGDDAALLDFLDMDTI